MRLLFITQKLHGQDSFGVLWVNAFIARDYEVQVLCLEGDPNASYPFPVHSMGKETGRTQAGCILEFEKKIVSLRYDRVFVHMSPVWYALGWWYWLAKGIPVYLWYTHYQMQLGVRLFGWFGTRFFCATPQSLPQYEGSPKKTVIGHGIDLEYWPKRPNRCDDPHRLLVVHRLSRSKRLELIIKALTSLPERYTLDVYGIDAEKDYAAELKRLVADLKLTGRVMFHGTVPMQKLPEIYTRHRLILNMASETIDKTMLEAMTCGCYPVTTAANAEAIGLRFPGYGRDVGIPAAPDKDTPAAIAAFVTSHSHVAPVEADEMYRIVKEGHSLSGLVERMDEYMRKGA